MDKTQHLDRLVKLACSNPHSMSFCAHETAEFSPWFAVAFVL